ncbi:hypothetical protein N9N67_12555, partial [Bacteriovoracaceae bacterium]|nr:hypothetical protein [Bacteriovoracaceae bacterium]
GKLMDGSIQAYQQVGTEATIQIDGEEIDDPMELRNEVTAVSGSFDIGIIEKLDIFLYGYDDAPPLLGAKYQFIGKSRKEAKEGDHSLAASYGFGKVVTTATNSDFSLFEDGNDIEEVEVSHDVKDLALIYGYRTQDDILVYASIHATENKVQLDIKEADDEDLEDEDRNYYTMNYGAALGATRYFESGLKVSLELSAQSVDWTDTDEKQFAFLSLSIGSSWD